MESGESEVSPIELQRRQDLRSHALVPIYVFWDSGVPQNLASAAQQGVRDALIASGQDRTIVVPGAVADRVRKYGSPDWYVSEAYRRQQLRRDVGFGPQLDVGEVEKLFHTEPWQSNPHWEVFIVNRDLNGQSSPGEYLNFCYGATDTGFASSVQSVRRFEAEIPNPQLQNDMVRHLLRHEVGHMFGLLGRSFRVEQKLGIHCANVCTMRQALTMSEAVEHVQEGKRLKIHFCSDCMDELAQYRSRYRPLE